MGAHYVALIPAKGSSLGVPGKNLQLVGDQTLLARTIDAAIAVERITSVVVSTEDLVVAEQAESLGADVHIRTGVAAGVEATAAQVVRNFLQSQVRTGGPEGLTVIYLQPTSPFRSKFHIESALDVLESGGGASLVSVCPAKQLPEKMVVSDGKIIRVESSAIAGHGANRQDLPRRFYPNGAIYIFSEGEFYKKAEVPIDGSLLFEMDELASVDIDSPADLEIARALAAYAGI